MSWFHPHRDDEILDVFLTSLAQEYKSLVPLISDGARIALQVQKEQPGFYVMCTRHGVVVWYSVPSRAAVVPGRVAAPPSGAKPWRPILTGRAARVS